MLFVWLCTDKPGSLDLRMKSRPEHVTYLESLGNKLKAAGPFTDDSGSPIGSMVIVEAKDRAEATAMAKADPYAKVGLFGSVEIKAWKWGLKNPEA